MTIKSGLVAVACLLLSQSFAQQTRKAIDEAMTAKTMVADTSKKGRWKSGGTFTLALAQQNSSYWVGVNEKFALNVGLNVDLYANRAWGKSTLDNTLKASYAYQNNQTQGLRKTADFFDWYTKFGHSLNEKKTLSLAAIFNLRSQFTNGYDYALTPRRRVSGFFAPANILLTPGLDWKPNKHFSLFFSPFAGKWIVVSNDPYSYSTTPPPPGQRPLAALYGVDPVKKVDAQFGAFLSANFNKELVKNVTYTSRLDLYSNYKHNPQNIDMFWTNSFGFKVNKWLTMSYLLNLAYDDDLIPEGRTSPTMQFLGTFGVGVSGKF
ncbi:MAG: DUF3078 domain-containing protein [Bacteroidetes bacterium]|uniref:DUF3078 domain-containing protein n=1 Tax=Phnomibacter sp. TaxID=2836217 RepID=UPI002FDCAAFD|nr:DUF3078 domain-containing protein [Bacteroidota bacterium]